MLFGSPVEPTMLPGILKTTFRAVARYPRGWESVYLFLAQKPTGVEHDDIGYGSGRVFSRFELNQVLLDLTSRLSFFSPRVDGNGRSRTRDNGQR